MEGGKPEGAHMEGQWGHVEGAGAEVEEQLPPFPLHHRNRNLPAHQVWSLPQIYSVPFSQSRIGLNKCVLNKGTINVSCF